MKTFYIDAPGKTSFGEIEMPACKPDEVLLRVKRVGFCGTDLNTFRGVNPLVSYPRIPGHEIAAIVEETGKDVPDHIKAGMQASVSPYQNCGSCPSCRRNRPNCCENNMVLGNQKDGIFNAYATINWRKLYPSEVLSIPELALVEPLVVSFHAVARGRMGPNDTVAVIGCGMIGLGVVAGAADRGAAVIGIDVDDNKLQIAQKAGASFTVNSPFTR